MCGLDEGLVLMVSAVVYFTAVLGMEHVSAVIDSIKILMYQVKNQ